LADFLYGSADRPGSSRVYSVYENSSLYLCFYPYGTYMHFSDQSGGQLGFKA